MSPDEVEVLHLEQTFIAAWNKGDARGAAASYADDGVRVGAFGDIAHGRRDIEAAYEKLLQGPMRGATIEWTPAVRSLAADVIIAKGRFTIRPPAGARPVEGHAADIWVRSAGRWQIAEAHPKLYPQPPGS